MSGDKATWSLAQSKRGGKRVRLRAQVSGGKWVSGARGSKGVRTCGGGRRTCGRGRVHGEGCEREVGDGLTGGLGRIEREREAGVRAKGTAPIGLAHWAARGREGARRLAPTGETRLSGTEGARGWA
jgi:hypothetical protein